MLHLLRQKEKKGLYLNILKKKKLRDKIILHNILKKKTKNPIRKNLKQNKEK